MGRTDGDQGRLLEVEIGWQRKDESDEGIYGAMEAGLLEVSMG